MMYSVVPHVDVWGSYLFEAECYFRLGFVPGLFVHGSVVVVERAVLFSIQKGISQLLFAAYLLWNILPQYFSWVTGTPPEKGEEVEGSYIWEGRSSPCRQRYLCRASDATGEYGDRFIRRATRCNGSVSFHRLW